MVTVIKEDDYLAHYGILRKSGRYPWGSGENPYQRSDSFLSAVEELKEKGLSDKEIADAFSSDDYKLTTTDLRAMRSIATNKVRAEKINQVQSLRDKGYSQAAISRRLDMPESTVRGYLKPGAADKADALTTTANLLKDQIKKKRYIDVGSGVEKSSRLGVSRTRLNTAIKMLQEEGYKLHRFSAPTVIGNMTKMKVLGAPDTEWKELINNQNLVQQIDAYTEDNGRSWQGLKPVQSIDSSRVAIAYEEDGGDKRDGVVYVRPGVEDVSLGNSRYAQVRIGVDGTHYIKGMAMYKEDLPEGVDLLFNTNKSKKDVTSMKDALKPMERDRKTGEVDQANPFGTSIKPGGQHGVMNIVEEEGGWLGWRDTLASQVLSKQSPLLAKSQLDMLYENKLNDLEDIEALTNPAVKRRLLESFADSADSSAVDLEAAALPRQNWHVILPVNDLKENEIYAPNYDNGETVALVRYPHGGIFEIPELRVNNKNREARKALGDQPIDAVGINAKVAERLSGADFDGDTVLVIPNDKGKIKTSPALAGLKDFDPKREYPGYEGMPEVKAKTKEVEMGKVSNLITDMTLQGAPQNEIARAVRHSMVVIDSEKHNLNYKLSAKKNGIPALKEKYQGAKNAGASTLISLAGSKVKVPAFRPRYVSEGGPIDKKTGKKVFVETGETYVNKKGETVVKNQPGKFKRLALVDDAHELSSGTTQEEIYADHSNRLKDLANRARLERERTKPNPVSRSAKEAYSEEVASLNSKLDLAIRNRPLERKAQLIAKAEVDLKKQGEPEMTSEDEKKLRYRALKQARDQVGASRVEIEFTPNEWEAVQAGAISNHKLEQMLARADLDQVRELATPRDRPVMTSVKIARAQNMAAAGYTQAEIARNLGVSTTAISDALTDGGLL